MRAFRATTLLRATRGGFARPDPKPYGKYKYTRRTHLQDINTVLYSDFAPEFYMHMHSIWVQHSRQGIALLCAYFAIVVAPLWAFAYFLHTKAGSGLYPSLRPGKDHEHMLPRLVSHFVRSYKPTHLRPRAHLQLVTDGNQRR